MSTDLALIHKNRKYFNCEPDLLVMAAKSQYKVHRIVFLCLSPYFQKVFECRSQTADSGQIDISVDNVEQLVITADKYNIVAIMKLCEQFLWSNLDADNCIETYLLSHYYNCYHLEPEVRQFIIENQIFDQLDGQSSGDFTIDMVLEEWQKRKQQLDL